MKQRMNGITRHSLTPGLLLVLSCLAFVSAQTVEGQQYRYGVRGRVIDEAGQPVVGAYVVVNPGPGGDLTVYTEADANGRFYFEESIMLASDERTLYATTPLFKGACDPIRPPFHTFSNLEGQQYAGQRITIKKNGGIDVGNVRVQVYYGLLNLVIHSYKGAPLSPAQKRNWQKAWVRVRNMRGAIVVDCRFPRNSDNLALALPEGTWYIEITPNYDKGWWFALNSPVVVRRSRSAQPVIFKVPRIRSWPIKFSTHLIE